MPAVPPPVPPAVHVPHPPAQGVWPVEAPAEPYPEEAVEPKKKPFPVVMVGIGAAVLLVAIGLLWYVLGRGKAPVETPPAQVSQPVTAPPPSLASNPPPQPAPAPATETPPEAPPVAESKPKPKGPPAVAATKKPRVTKPAAAPVAPPPAPVANPKAEQIASLQNMARDAYAKGNYAEPAAANAIAYAKQVLALDPGNDYVKSLLEDSVNGGKYQVQQALRNKDFAAAHRVADALAVQLPGRSDVTSLSEDITAAEKAEAAARTPKAPTALLSFRAIHMHSDKAPADGGPYCRGLLSVVAGHMKFVGETASPGQSTDTLDLGCANIKEIKKNARVASHQNGFHVKTASTNINFVPEDSSAAHITSLASACSK